MRLGERLTCWSYQRQLLTRPKMAPLEALRAVVGVYSTHPSAPLALLARCGGLTPEHFRALEERREVVRMPAMRGSAFMLPTETAHRVFAATGQPLEKYAGSLRYGGLDLEAYARLTPRVLECCATPVTPAELRTCAASKENVYMVARVLARQGRILRVGKSLRTDQLRFVATRAWLGHELVEQDVAGSLAWLAGEYLRAFGPARVADFAWWAGVPRRSALAALGKVTTVGRDELLVLAEDAAAFDRCKPVDPNVVAVLPKWDSYTMGYAADGRQRFIDDRYLSLAYTSVTSSPGATSGDGLPLILKGGRAIATWSHRFDGNRLLVSVTPFVEGETAPRDAVFDDVGELLSASSLSVTPRG